MEFNLGYIVCLVFLIKTFARSTSAEVVDKFGIGKTTSEIVELRGYIAKDHYVITQDGYILNLVQVLNPLIKNGFIKSKQSVLFIHGLASNANSFLFNTISAKPKNYGHLDASKIRMKKLIKLLNGDPAANSLVYLLSNFGHNVWLLNRRGSYQSQGHTSASKQPLENPIEGPIENAIQVIDDWLGNRSKVISLFGKHVIRKRQAETRFNETLFHLGNILLNALKVDSITYRNQFNPRYWNYSLDEQAKYDIPDVIDYILELNRDKNLTVVGHSSGGALTLMSLSLYPELNNKISRGIILAPALYPTSIPFEVLSKVFGKFLFNYIGPFPPKSSVELIEGLTCTLEVSGDTICEFLFDALFGFGGHQQSILPEAVSTSLDIASSHEIVSFLQGSNKVKMHHFDYLSEERNLIAYNQTKPPIYDVSKIKLRKLTFMTGSNDGLITPRSVFNIAKDMKVPVEKIYIKKPGIFFNHVGFMFHRNASTLVNIPALQRIESN